MKQTPSSRRPGLKPDPSQPNRGSRSYWLRLLAFFAVTLAAAVALLPAMLGGLFTLGLLYAPCSENPQTPADFGLSAEAVTLPARAGGSFRGYFIPGTNGATIIMPPPYTSGRGVRLPEAAMLAHHGYAVLTFESRRCAGMGPLSLGYNEVDEVADALDYLTARPGIDPNRVGVHGFSSAGATAVMAAARLPGLRAVIAEGGYGDFAENTLGRPSGFNTEAYVVTLFGWASRLTYRLVLDLEMSRLSPAAVIDQIAPRPVLLIYGSREASLVGARQQLAAAGPNTELWIVPEAGHGEYLAVAPVEYEASVVAFFDQHLLALDE